MIRLIVLSFLLSVGGGFLASCASQQSNQEISQEIDRLEGEIGDDEDFDEASGDSESTDEAEELYADEDEDAEELAEGAEQLEVADEEPIQDEAEDELDQVAMDQGSDDIAEEGVSEEEFADPFSESDEDFQAAMETPPVRIKDIKFLANRSGGTVIVETDAPAVFKQRSKVETNQLVIDIANSSLPSKLRRPYILKDFKKAAFSGINAYQKTGSAVSHVVIQLKKPMETVVQQEENAILVFPESPVELAPEATIADKGRAGGEDQKIKDAFGLQANVPLGPEAPQDDEEFDVNVDYSKGGTPEAYVDYRPTEETKDILLSARTLDEYLLKHDKFYGKPISIQVKEAGIKDVLDFLAEEIGLNMLVSETVEGNITVKLRKVPWDQALILILKAKGLGYVRQGNVIRIAQISELEAEKLAAKEIIDNRNNTEPLQVKIIPVSYAELSELQQQVAAFLSPRGRVVNDLRTSSLIITDIEENIVKSQKLIKELDVPPTQVLIEGKIVEAIETYSRGVGINWVASGSQTVLSDSGGLDGSPVTVFPGLSINPVGPDFGGVGTLNLQVGVLEVLGTLDAQVALLEKKDMARVISSPRIITLNREAATFSQTVQIPYLTATDPGPGEVAQTQVGFQDLTLSLEVTPQVTASRSVIMKVNVAREVPTGTSAIAQGAVGTSQSSAETNILVQNNQSAVVGGIYSGSNTMGENRVPVLSNIPVLGWLFKSKSTEKAKTELVIFVTPRILDSEETLRKAEIDTETESG